MKYFTLAVAVMCYAEAYYVYKYSHGGDPVGPSLSIAVVLTALAYMTW